MAEQKIMTRVMKLLELANDPNATEAERTLAAEHADRLMAQHMIDRMDLKSEDKSKIVQDHWDMRVGEAGNEFYYHVIKLMETVVTHCGIRVHPKSEYATGEDGKTDYMTRRFLLVGFPEDMAYAEQIWFRVFHDFVANISPKWDSSKSLPDNVYAFIKAGYSWIDTYRIARRIQYREWPETMPNGGPRLRTAYKQALAERGESFSKTRTRDAYRATFVESYGTTIRRRLVELRNKAKEIVSDADKFALAIRSTKEQVDEEFYRLFPEYDPAVRMRMKAAEAAQAVEDFLNLTPSEQKYVIAHVAEAEAKAQREYEAWAKRQERSRNGYGAVREKVTYDHSAWERGHETAKKVNLNVDAEVAEDKKKELA